MALPPRNELHRSRLVADVGLGGGGLVCKTGQRRAAMHNSAWLPTVALLLPCVWCRRCTGRAAGGWRG